MFQITNQVGGPVKADGGKFSYTFPYSNVNIKSVEVSCHCSEATIDTAKQEIRVTFTAPRFPEHLLLQGKKQYQSVKNLTVKYTTQEQPDVELTKILTFSTVVNL